MKNGILLLFCLVLCVASNAQLHSLPMKISKAHPYLFANSEKLKALTKSQDPTVVLLKDLIITRANIEANQQTLPLPKGGANFGYMRKVQGRVLFLTAAYRMTAQKKYLEAAREQLMDLADIGNWGTYHFLDIGEAALAAGVGYDWLYSELTLNERIKLENAIINKALKPSMAVKDEEASWMRGDFNWNQVCHGGLSVAALAIFDKYREQSKLIIERAIDCVPYAAKVYYPDGVYPEGASYWEYGTTFQVLLIEALKTSFGHCYGLDAYEGFMETADFRVQMCGTTGMEYSYSDYHRDLANEPVMSWFARELSCADLQLNELEKVKLLVDQPERVNRLTVFDLIWWEPISCKKDAKRLNLQCWQGNGKMPIAIMRTDEAHNHAYVGFKGGTPYHSHGHQDSGSFIYESKGIRWALDLGTESYDKMRSAKLDLWNYSQNSSRWTTFRTGPDAHNLARIDNEPLITKGVADNMQFTEQGDCGIASLEITPLYNSDKIDYIWRTILLSENGDMLLTDSVKTKKDIELSSQWITDADVVRVSDGVRLKKDNKEIYLVVEPSCEVSINDVSYIPGIQNSENPGVICIRFTKKLQENTDGVLQIIVKNTLK